MFRDRSRNLGRTGENRLCLLASLRLREARRNRRAQPPRAARAHPKRGQRDPIHLEEEPADLAKQFFASALAQHEGMDAAQNQTHFLEPFLLFFLAPPLEDAAETAAERSKEPKIGRVGRRSSAEESDDAEPCALLCDRKGDLDLQTRAPQRLGAPPVLFRIGRGKEPALRPSLARHPLPADKRNAAGESGEFPKALFRLVPSAEVTQKSRFPVNLPDLPEYKPKGPAERCEKRGYCVLGFLDRGQNPENVPLDGEPELRVSAARELSFEAPDLRSCLTPLLDHHSRHSPSRIAVVVSGSPSKPGASHSTGSRPARSARPRGGGRPSGPLAGFPLRQRRGGHRIPLAEGFIPTPER